MPRKPGKPKLEPLQPGDEQIAREEVEAFYARPVEVARAELAAVQERFDRVQADAEASLAAFRAGERLPKMDAYGIEVHAGGHGDIGMDILSGRSTDRAAYDRAKARGEATNRWLRHEGYESVAEAR
jgi:hypothetical protein